MALNNTENQLTQGSGDDLSDKTPRDTPLDTPHTFTNAPNIPSNNALPSPSLTLDGSNIIVSVDKLLLPNPITAEVPQHTRVSRVSMDDVEQRLVSVSTVNSGNLTSSSHPVDPVDPVEDKQNEWTVV